MEALEPGRAVKQYRIIASLGAGGMGEVYLAEDTILERKVAIKVLRERTTGEADHVRRFFREAKATSALSHANIAQIYEIGEENRIRFLVLEYVEGRTLREVLTEGSIELSRLLDIAIDIASGLAAAESRGVLHRDLKPSNIMITPAGQAKILDFGLARMQHTGDQTLTELTQAGAVIGTVAYMSPEQALGLELDRRSDIFSLGIILYEMASGKSPFQARSMTEMLVHVVHQEAPPLVFEDAVDGPRLAAIIGRCLEKDRDRRYGSAADLLKDLQQLRLDRIVRQTTTLSATGARPVRSPGPPRHVLAWIVAAVAVLIAAFLLVRSAGNGDISSIAVLPFENQTGDPKLDYVADGLTSTLIDDFSRLPHLRVMSYDAVHPYRNRLGDARKAGGELHVGAVVTGRLVGDSSSSRVQVDVVDTKTGAELWGHPYARDSARLLAIEQEISREVSERLGASGRIASSASPDAARERAYDLYLQAVYAFHEVSAESTHRAADLLRQAVQVDPSYALPHAYLGFTYLLAMNAASQPATTLLPQARAEAMQALSLDQNSPDARFVLGFVKVLNYDWQGAESEFKRALALNPNHSAVLQTYALFVLAAEGRSEEALAEINRALDVDPGHTNTSVYKGRILFYARRYPDAVNVLKDAIARDPNFFWSHFTLGQVYLSMSRFPQAIAELNTPPYRTAGNAKQLAAIADAQAAARNPDALAPLLSEIAERMKQSYISSADVAKVYAALGEKDRAFELLNQAYQERDQGLIAIKVDPEFDALHSDPRFHELLRKMNLEK